MTSVYIGLGAAVLLAAWAIYTYNFLIHARNKVAEAYSGIDVQLKQRHDLVPNLVKTVRAYADHEHKVFEAVTAIRNQALEAHEPKAVERVENKLARQMHSVIVLAERYPDLKASEHFQKLADQLVEVEDEIQASRALYNANVQFYNSRAQSIPAAVIADHLSPRAFPYLDFDYVETDGNSLTAGKFAA